MAPAAHDLRDDVARRCARDSDLHESRGAGVPRIDFRTTDDHGWCAFGELPNVCCQHGHADDGVDAEVAQQSSRLLHVGGAHRSKAARAERCTEILMIARTSDQYGPDSGHEESQRNNS
jgi:hypothetical protein